VFTRFDCASDLALSLGDAGVELGFGVGAGVAVADGGGVGVGVGVDVFEGDGVGVELGVGGGLGVSLGVGVGVGVDVGVGSGLGVLASDGLEIGVGVLSSALATVAPNTEETAKTITRAAAPSAEVLANTKLTSLRGDRQRPDQNRAHYGIAVVS